MADYVSSSRNVSPILPAKLKYSPRDCEDTVIFRKPDLPCCVFPVIADIRRQGKLCDVTLKVGEQKFSAHRIILAASIPYFNAMFTHDMIESKQNEITIEGIDPSALEALVNYAYTGCIAIDKNNAQALLIAASFLNMQAVRDACCNFFKDRLHVSNCLPLRTFADQYMCVNLVEASNKFIQYNFKQVSETEEFLNLCKQDVLELITNDELNVNTEEEVFEAVLKWIKYKEDERKVFLPELMVQVRLPLLTPPYLSDRVATENLIKNSLRCRDLLDEARDYLLMPERRTLMQTFKTRPRCCTDIPGIIYAVGGLTPCGNSLNTVERFDPVTGNWVVSEAMTTTRSRVGIAVLGGLLYAIGGYNGVERLNTVEAFIPTTNQWKRVAPMNCKRSALGAASVYGKLFVCGGYDGISSLHSVEMYDPRTDTWTLVTPMKNHRSASGVAVLDGEVYICGGHDGLSIFDSVECYNCTSGQWHDMPSMRSKRCRLGVAALKGKLYAVGGYDGNVFLRTVECFDPKLGQWKEVSPMKMKRSRVAVAATYGKLFAIGGYDGQTKLASVEMYDPQTDKWVIMKPMITHEGGVGVGVVPNEDPNYDPIFDLSTEVESFKV